MVTAKMINNFDTFYVNDLIKFTRPWFAWANSLFAEFVLSYIEGE